jgi:hypothetical protein
MDKFCFQFRHLSKFMPKYAKYPLHLQCLKQFEIWCTSSVFLVPFYDSFFAGYRIPRLTIDKRHANTNSGEGCAKNMIKKRSRKPLFLPFMPVLNPPTISYRQSHPRRASKLNLYPTKDTYRHRIQLCFFSGISLKARDVICRIYFCYFWPLCVT